MKIKDGCQASTMDFWYDLTDGGYLKPEEMLEDPSDAERVRSALAVLYDFRDSCEEQIEDFIQ